METQGIVIWASGVSGALIVWCADSGALVYVADRKRAGDPNGALCVGDFVALRVETVGAMRVGRDLRYRAAGASWVQDEIGREAKPHLGPVIARDPRLSHGFGFDGDTVDGANCAEEPANGESSDEGNGVA